MNQLKSNVDLAYATCEQAYAKLSAHCEECPVCCNVEYEDNQMHGLCPTGRSLEQTWDHAINSRPADLDALDWLTFLSELVGVELC